MHEIDEMDIIGYLKVRAWKFRDEKKKHTVYIDQIWQDIM